MVWCEGESDSLAFEEAFGGYWDEFASFYVSIASPGAGIVKAEWAALLHGMQLVYVAGDGDSAGRGFCCKVCRLLPWARVLPIPEGRDLRDLLQHEGRRAVCALMDEADRGRDLFAAKILARDVDEFLAVRFTDSAGRSG